MASSAATRLAQSRRLDFLRRQNPAHLPLRPPPVTASLSSSCARSTRPPNESHSARTMAAGGRSRSSRSRTRSSRCNRFICRACTWMRSTPTTWRCACSIRRHEPVLPWLLPGNYLDGRVPLLISFYHGSQQIWLGLPFFWLFGTAVDRPATHACDVRAWRARRDVRVARTQRLEALAGRARLRRARDRPVVLVRVSHPKLHHARARRMAVPRACTR